MPTSRVYIEQHPANGRVYYFNTPLWSTITNDSGTPSTLSTNQFQIGGYQDSGGDYYMYQSFFAVDISNDVPENATITSIVASLKVLTWTPDIDFTLQIRSFDWSPPPVDSTDFQSTTQLNALSLLAEYDTADYAASDNIEFTSLPAFASNLNRTGITYLMFNSDRNAAGTAPTYPNDEYVILRGNDISNTTNSWLDITWEQNPFLGANF